jgi:transcriptional regulator with XRE-family HTH domain
MGILEFGLTLPAAVGTEESALVKKRVATTREGAQAIGQRLAALRKAKGLTQIDVAKALDITQTLISKYERGDLLLHGELIAQFSGLLGVPTDDILGVARKRGARAASAVPILDKTLARRLAQLQALPRRDRDALLRTLDAFLFKTRPAA